jgi:hypothetical protein
MRRMGLSSPPQTLTPNFGQPRPAAPPLGGATSSTEATTSLGGAVTPAYDMAPRGISQAEYDIALNRTMQTGRPPDLSSALTQVQPPQVPPPPVDVGPPAPKPAPKVAPAPNKTKPPAAKPSAKTLPKPKNKQEFDALPKGAHFLDPNGEERIKP